MTTATRSIVRTGILRSSQACIGRWDEDGDPPRVMVGIMVDGIRYMSQVDPDPRWKDSGVGVCKACGYPDEQCHYPSDDKEHWCKPYHQWYGKVVNLVSDPELGTILELAS